MTYTKAQIEDAVEVLLTGNYGNGNVCMLDGHLAWEALASLWTVHGQCLLDIHENYAEAAGLLLGGWLPGDPLVCL